MAATTQTKNPTQPRATISGDKLADSVIYQMRVLVRRARSRIKRRYDKKIGSRPQNQWDVLVELAGSHPEALTASEISKRTEIDKFTLSRIVAALVKEGLVSRADGKADKRKTNLSLTCDGMTLARKVKKHGIELTNDVLGTLTQAELMMLEMLVAKLNDHMNELIDADT